MGTPTLGFRAFSGDMASRMQTALPRGRTAWRHRNGAWVVSCERVRMTGELAAEALILLVTDARHSPTVVTPGVMPLAPGRFGSVDF